MLHMKAHKGLNQWQQWVSPFQTYTLRISYMYKATCHPLLPITRYGDISIDIHSLFPLELLSHTSNVFEIERCGIYFPFTEHTSVQAAIIYNGKKYVTHKPINARISWSWFTKKCFIRYQRKAVMNINVKCMNYYLRNCVCILEIYSYSLYQGVNP